MSNYDKALELLKQSNAQNLADIDTQKAQAISDLNTTLARNVARTGMNYSSLYGTQSNEGQAKLEAEALRSRNLENISNSQKMLDILSAYGNNGSGAAGTTPIPTRPDTTGTSATASALDSILTGIGAVNGAADNGLYFRYQNIDSAARAAAKNVSTTPKGIQDLLLGRQQAAPIVDNGPVKSSKGNRLL